jgi:hypothetical protein
MTRFNKFRKEMLTQQGLSDRFVCQESFVHITSKLEVLIDDELVGEAQSLEEAREYARNYIQHKKVIDNIDTLIPEEKVVNLIKKHHDLEKITSTIVESYIDLASSDTFSLDPVITELKETSITGKYTYKLEDDSIVAISEQTQQMLSDLLEDKYQIIEYMRKNKDNFMHVIRELKEE